MSTTATVNANEGWTFTNAEQANTETEHDNDWGIPANATTTDGWNTPPPTPLPLLSAVGLPHANDHASLYWTACYDDDCSTHRQMKDYNYYPQRSSRRRRHRRNRQMCDCPMPHPHELVKVTWERHLDPVKACADWQRGKRVCPECRFLMNIENHNLRCSAAAPCAPLADVTPPQEDQEAAPAGHAPVPATDPIAAATMTAAPHQEKKNLPPERSDARNALDVSDATCLTRTMVAMAPCIRTHRPRRMRLDE